MNILMNCVYYRRNYLGTKLQSYMRSKKVIVSLIVNQFLFSSKKNERIWGLVLKL